jgi:hypothetical protein
MKVKSFETGEVIGKRVSSELSEPYYIPGSYCAEVDDWVHGMVTENGILCAECMSETDWKHLHPKDMITLGFLESQEDVSCSKCSLPLLAIN